MSKQEFLNRLEALLQNMPEDERQDILYDYEEHFQNGTASGKNEAEIAASLGSPQTIAKEIMASYQVAQAAKEASPGNILKAVLATVSLGFINLVFVLGPLLAIAGVLFALYSMTLALIAAPVVMLADIALQTNLSGVLSRIFKSMISLGSGLLLGIGMISATRWVIYVFLKYLRFNIEIIKGE